MCDGGELAVLRVRVAELERRYKCRNRALLSLQRRVVLLEEENARLRASCNRSSFWSRVFGKFD